MYNNSYNVEQYMYIYTYIHVYVHVAHDLVVSVIRDEWTSTVQNYMYELIALKLE